MAKAKTVRAWALRTRGGKWLAMPGELPTGKAREWRLNVVKDIRQAALLDSETKAAEVRVMFSRDGAVLEVVELTLTCLQA